jgi:hypothetical protein
VEGLPRNLDSPGEQVPERERDWRREHAPLSEDPDALFELTWDWIHASDFPAMRDTPRVSDWCHAH